MAGKRALSARDQAEIALSVGLSGDVLFTLVSLGLNSYEVAYAQDPVAAVQGMGNLIQLLTDVGAVISIYNMGKTEPTSFTGTWRQTIPFSFCTLLSATIRGFNFYADMNKLTQGDGKATVGAITIVASIPSFIGSCYAANKVGQEKQAEEDDIANEEFLRRLG